MYDIPVREGGSRSHRELRRATHELVASMSDVPDLESLRQRGRRRGRGPGGVAKEAAARSVWSGL